jgi:hypothetical protein
MCTPDDIGAAVQQMVHTPPHTLQFIVEVRPLSPKRRRDGTPRG